MTRVDHQQLSKKTDGGLYPAIRVKYHIESASKTKIFPVSGGEYCLPSYGTSYANCGSVRFQVKCDSCDDSFYIKENCGRKECPVCYRSWVVRRARAATARLEAGYKAMGGRYRPRHIVMSFPKRYYSTVTYAELLKESTRLINKYTKGGVHGGVVIGHPWRFRDSQGNGVSWKHSDLNKDAEYPIEDSYAVYSPHVHMIMYGWFINSDEIERETGVVVHVIDQLPNDTDVFGAVYYQLTHCGIGERTHALRWFGNMSYNSFLKVREWQEKIFPVCEVCGGQLWTWSVGGEKLEPYSIEATRYHFKFKERQRTLEPVPRVKHGNHQQNRRTVW